MADLNKVYLIGRLTFDPELRHTAGGVAVADLRLATSRTWLNKAGEKQEDTLYVDVTTWNRTAEACCQYLAKGSQVHVEGYLKLEQWEDKTSGEKRSKIKVESERVQFLDRKDRQSEPGTQNGNEGHEQVAATTASSRPSRGGPRTVPPRPTTDNHDEDIPF